MNNLSRSKPQQDFEVKSYLFPCVGLFVLLSLVWALATVILPQQ